MLPLRWLPGWRFMRRAIRWLITCLVVGSVFSVVWGLFVWRWPRTALDVQLSIAALGSGLVSLPLTWWASREMPGTARPPGDSAPDGPPPPAPTATNLISGDARVGTAVQAGEVHGSLILGPLPDPSDPDSAPDG